MTGLAAEGAVFHPDCAVTDSDFGPFTEVGQGSRIANSRFGAYSYCDRFCDIANAEIGKFANIASFVRIGATDHPLDRASLHHFMYRSAAYWEDAEDDVDWFARRASRKAMIGHLDRPQRAGQTRGAGGQWCGDRLWCHRHARCALLYDRGRSPNPTRA